MKEPIKELVKVKFNYKTGAQRRLKRKTKPGLTPSSLSKILKENYIDVIFKKSKNSRRKHRKYFSLYAILKRKSASNL